MANGAAVEATSVEEAGGRRTTIWSVLKATKWMILIGLAIVILTALFKPWFDARLCVAQAGETGLKCPLLYDYAFDKGILLNIGIGLMGLPLLWAVYVDKLWKSVNELFVKLITAASRTPAVVIDQIREGAIASEHLRQLLHDCIRYYDGRDNTMRRKFATYLGETLSGLSDGDEAVYRSRYSANISIMPTAGSIGSRYYRWSETIQYSIEGRAGQTYSLSASSRIACDAGELTDVVGRWSFTIKTDALVFDFAQVRQSIDFTMLAHGTPWEQDGVTLHWTAGQLVIRVEKKLVLKSDRLDVLTEEDSFISHDDRDYTLAMRYPTCGMQLELRVPPGYRIVTKSFSPVSIDANATCKLDSDGTKATLHHGGWFMPGLAAVLVWTPAP